MAGRNSSSTHSQLPPVRGRAPTLLAESSHEASPARVLGGTPSAPAGHMGGLRGANIARDEPFRRLTRHGKHKRLPLADTLGHACAAVAARHGREHLPEAREQAGALGHACAARWNTGWCSFCRARAPQPRCSQLVPTLHARRAGEGPLHEASQGARSALTRLPCKAVVHPDDGPLVVRGHVAQQDWLREAGQRAHCRRSKVEPGSAQREDNPRLRKMAVQQGWAGAQHGAPQLARLCACAQAARCPRTASASAQTPAGPCRVRDSMAASLGRASSRQSAATLATEQRVKALEPLPMPGPRAL